MTQLAEQASVPVPMAVAVPDVRGSGAGGFSGTSSRSADLARLGITEADIELVQLNFPGAIADLRTGMFLTESGEEMGGILSLASQLK